MSSLSRALLAITSLAVLGISLLLLSGIIFLVSLFL